MIAAFQYLKGDYKKERWAADFGAKTKPRVQNLLEYCNLNFFITYLHHGEISWQLCH